MDKDGFAEGGGKPLLMPLLVENWPLVAVAAGVIVAFGLAMLSLREALPPFERRGVLLAPAQISFLRTLQSAVREDWVIFSMVRLADLIKVRPKTRRSQTWHSRIHGKHVDFVLCDCQTLEVKLAIELDDPSQPRGERDRFVVASLTAAGLPLLRVRAREKYETAAVRKDIEDALGILRKKKGA